MYTILNPYPYIHITVPKWESEIHAAPGWQEERREGGSMKGKEINIVVNCAVIGSCGA